MKRVGYVCAAIAAVLSFLAAGGPAQGSALAGRAAVLEPQAPSSPLTGAFTYQGVIAVGGAPYNGSCDFQFFLYSAASGGTLLGSVAHTLSVSDGLFSDTLDFGMGPFSGSQRWLEVQARCPTGVGSYALLGRQELTAAPYSLYSVSAGSIPWSGVSSRPAGLDDGDNDALGALSCLAGQIPKWNGSAWACAADAGGPVWKNLKTVALSGAEYTSIQAAVDAISGEAADNPYLVLVGPGVYTETVTLKPFVHLVGAGQEVTIIRGKGDNLSAGGVVNLASDTSLRDLTAWNYGHQPGFLYVAVNIKNAIHVLVQDVTARADGMGGSKAGIYLTGTGGSAARLVHTTALAKEEDYNYGMIVDPGSTAEITGGTFAGEGGSEAYGIYANGSSTLLDIQDADLYAAHAAVTTVALKLMDGASADLFGGNYTATVGDSVIGIYAVESSLVADSIHAEALGGETASIGIKASTTPLAYSLVLRDSTVEAAKGDLAEGLEAVGIDLLSEGNVIRARYGFDSTIGALAKTTGARMKGDQVDAVSDAGTEVVGIRYEGQFQAQEEIVRAEGSMAVLNVFGLHGTAGSTGSLVGGTYTAVSGQTGVGVYSQGLMDSREVVAFASEAGMASGLKCEEAACNVWGGTYAAAAAAAGAHGIFLFNSPFAGSDFNASGTTSPSTFGLFVALPINPLVSIHMAVLEGTTSSVFAVPGPIPTIVDIGSSRLVGAPVSAPFPVIQCTLTSRSGMPGPTVVLGPCP